MNNSSLRTTVANLAAKIGGRDLSLLVTNHFGKIGASLLVIVAVVIGYLLGFDLDAIMTWLGQASAGG